MGHVSSKHSQEVKYASYGPPTKEYFLTFTGNLDMKTNKIKRQSYATICEKIANDSLWSEIVNEIMRDSFLHFLGMEIESSDYPPIHDVRVIMNDRPRSMNNVLSGTLCWKSIPMDLQLIADAIIQRTVDVISSNTIRESSSNWSFHFIPSRLNTD